MMAKAARQAWCSWVVLALMVLGAGMPMRVRAEGALDKIKRTNTLVIAYLNGTMPFAFVNGDGQVTGYTVELCRKIAEGIRKDFKLPQMRVQFMEVDTVMRFIALDQGKADLECSMSTNNAQRRKMESFTVPHFFASVRMLVKANSGIRNWEDLRGKTVAVPRNTPMVKQIEERSSIRSLGIKVVEVTYNEEAFSRVENGMADAFVMEDVLLRRHLLAVPHPERYAVVGDSLSLEAYGIVMRKGDPKFKRYVDLQMVKIVRSGEIFRLYDRWFMKPISATIPAMGMPMGHLLRDTLSYPTDKVGDE